MRLGSAKAVAALVAMSASTFTYVTTEVLPIGLLPLIADDLHTTRSAVGLLVTGYGLVVVVASIPLTRLTHGLPRRGLLAGLLAAFVVATFASALAPTYWLLLASRVLIALSQALFWSVITPAAGALFAAEVRGRALSVLYAGSSLAGVLGVPAGTWLGQQAGWRTAFLAMSALGLVIAVAVAALLPDIPAGQSDADRGSEPDAGRYQVLVVATALAVTGAFTAFTYVSPFLTDVSGFDSSATGMLLLVRGIAGVAGVVLVGLIVDRNPWLTMLVAVAVQAAALALQYLLGAAQPAAAVTIAVSGLTLAALSAVLGARVLQVAPGSSDLASAGTSTAFNVGITGGALIGSVLLSQAGARSTALAGALLTLAAVAAICAEPALSSARRAARPRPVSA